jgi:hypothetical protein
LVWCFKIGKKEVGISDETKTIFHQVQNCKKSLFQACVRVIFTPSGNKGKSGADGLIGLSARPGYRNAAGFLFTDPGTSLCGLKVGYLMLPLHQEACQLP